MASRAGAPTRTGGPGPTPELLRPLPSTVYRVDGRHVFVTDEHGRVVHVRSRLQYTDGATADATRHSGSQTEAGGKDRRRKPGWPMEDQGGHWIAATLGGPGELINMGAMVRRLNGNRKRNLYPDSEAWRTRVAAYLENYYRQEEEWRVLLKAGKQVELEIRISYPKPAPDDPAGVSQRPKSFTVYPTVDGVAQDPMRFRNDTWVNP